MSNVLTADNSTSKLATFLRTFLNTQFAKEIVASNGEIPSNTVVIRGVTNWDDPSTPLTDFPLLKVYKNTDNFRKGTTFRESNGAVVYCISYPQLNVLPNLLDWMAYQINLGLLTYERTEQDIFPPINNSGYVAQYLISVNEATQSIYPFLRFDINFKNFCDQHLYQQ